MKKRNILSLILILGLAFAFQSCFKETPAVVDSNLYSTASPILYPEDTFGIRMDLIPNRLISTSIIFDDTSVWSISTSPPTNIPIWLAREEDPTIQLILQNGDILVGLDGNINYIISGKNNASIQGNNKIIVSFRKTAIDYDEADETL